MDKRYSGMRFYDGTRASDKRAKTADRILKSYMSNIKSQRRKDEDYGGSTGGYKSIDSARGLQAPGYGAATSSGLRQIKQRQTRQSDLREVFKTQGSGRYGARFESFIGRMTDPGSEEREVAIRKQKGMSDDDEFTSS